MADGVLSVRLGPDKARWKAHCAAQGVAPSTLLRRAIERELSGANDTDEPIARPRQTRPERDDDQRKARFEILLTESERAAIDVRSAAEGCSRRRWIVDAIRVGLTHEAQPSTRELKLLGDSNYQLTRIGTNLNQIARRLHENQAVDEFVEIMVEKLSERIDLHIDLVSATIRASVDRWVIE